MPSLVFRSLVCYPDPNMFPYYLFYIPIFFIAWAIVFPEQAVEVIENMKRSLGAYIVAHITRREVHLLRAQFRKWGKLKGYDRRLIDDFFAQNSPEILRRIEARYLRVDIEELVSRPD